jgi:NAD(P)-dependent dehydrogenase (short-subunit alcohol dehydrogenase family)
MPLFTSNPNLTVLVTGANRGIGLELVKQLRARGQGVTVIGTARDPDDAPDLRKAASEVYQLDQTSQRSVDALARKLEGRSGGIDLLINNGAMGGGNGAIDDLDLDELDQFFKTNAVGPMRVLKALLPNLRKGSGKTVVNISTVMSSIANAGGGYYGYRASKAALNMLARLAAKDLEADRVMVVNLHPGWVQTRMGGEDAAISAKTSVEGMLRVIDNLTPSMRGGLYDYQGEKIPW